MKNCHFFTLLFLLTIIHLANTAIIALSSTKNLVNVQCFGNVEIVNGKCVSCKQGWVSINKQCVKLQFEYASVNAQAVIPDPNCQIKDSLSSNCLVCNVGYYRNDNKTDKAYGKCVQNNCLIYSQALRKCLDSQLSNLASYLPEKSYRIPNKESQGSQIIMARDAKGTLELPLFNLPDKSIFFKEEVGQSTATMNQNSNKNIKYSSEIQSQTSVLRKQKWILHADSYFLSHNLQNSCSQSNDENKCIKCRSGYFLNKLLDTCHQLYGRTIQIQKQQDIIIASYYDKNCLAPNPKYSSDSDNILCLQCAVGFHYSSTANKCMIADPLCKKVDSRQVCQQCYQDYQLITNKCVLRMKINS